MIEGQTELKIDGIFHVEPSANENENYGFSGNRDIKKGEDEPFDVGLNEREEKFVLPTK